MSEYISDYQAPPYSILERRQEGLKLITTIVLDGDVIDFEITRSVAEDGKKFVSEGEE
jgi:dimeric dUTPase (all-alpha-NTP-PPase superfamily)